MKNIPPIGYALSPGRHHNGYPKVYSHSYAAFRGNWTILVPNRFGQHSASKPQPAVWRTRDGAEGYKTAHPYGDIQGCVPIEVYPNDLQLQLATKRYAIEMLEALCDPSLDASALLDRVWAEARNTPFGRA